MKFIHLVSDFFFISYVVAESINKTDLNPSNNLSPSDNLPSGNDVPNGDDVSINDTLPLSPTRRILRGDLVGHTRPYMVYLRPARDDKDRVLFESHWLCGGVIIHARYILTSAACIEDVGNFYVISGTHRFLPAHLTNECITNGAKKAVWKCIPQSYFFDGDAFDNIRWMVGDIAVVKVEDDFNFKRRIRGCDFVPKMIAFNNRTRKLERSGIVASIAGWGSTDKFINIDVSHARLRNASNYAVNSVQLLEASVMLISKKGCKKHWEDRYHFIIQEEMICSKDSTDYEPVAAACLEHGIDCKEVGHSDEDYYNDKDFRRKMGDREDRRDQEDLLVHTAAHQIPTRRNRLHAGGFCENDHGGPLIIGQGKSSVVIGIMSACQTRQISHKCYGPFLYTSVYKYRGLISCAIDKNVEEECKSLLKASHTQLRKTVFDWSGRLPLSQLTSEESDQPRRWQVRQRINNQVPLNSPNTIANTVSNMSVFTPLQDKYKYQQLNNGYETTADSFGGIKNVIMRRFYNKL